MKLGADFSRGAQVRGSHTSFSRPPPGGQATRLNNALSDLLSRFAEEIASVWASSARGSGNFLSISLQRLLNSEREVITFTAEVGLPIFAHYRLLKSYMTLEPIFLLCFYLLLNLLWIAPVLFFF